MQYRLVILPKGKIPKTVSYEAMVTMELNELADEGWRPVSINRSGSQFMPMDVLLERDND